MFNFSDINHWLNEFKNVVIYMTSVEVPYFWGFMCLVSIFLLMFLWSFNKTYWRLNAGWVKTLKSDRLKYPSAYLPDYYPPYSALSNFISYGIHDFKLKCCYRLYLACDYFGDTYIPFRQGCDGWNEGINKRLIRLSISLLSVLLKVIKRDIYFIFLVLFIICV